MKLYHGTDNKNVEKILQNGFQTKRSGAWALGRGIYFTPDINEAANYGDSILEVEVEDEIIEEEILDLGDNGHDLEELKNKANNYEYAQDYKDEGDKIVSYVIEELMLCGIKFNFDVGVHICFFNVDGLFENGDIKEVVLND